MTFFVAGVKGNYWLGHLMGGRHCGFWSVLLRTNMCFHGEELELCWADPLCGSTSYWQEHVSIHHRQNFSILGIFMYFILNRLMITDLGIVKKRVHKKLNKQLCQTPFPPSFPGSNSPTFASG